MLKPILAALATLPHHLYDIALWQDGEIVCHRFGESNLCNDSYSVAKAFTMTAIGMLWDEQKLTTDLRIADLFPEYFETPRDPNWQLVTLEHALTHTMGLAKDCLDIDTMNMAEYPSEDFLEILFSQPLPEAPGDERYYTDAAFCLVARVVERVSGETVDAFLWRRLLCPMRFREAAWSRDPLGYPVGATGLYITTADMVKLGALYLKGGCYAGRRYLSEAWVRRAMEHEYELHPAGEHLVGKGGMLGQYVGFAPKAGFAIAWHGCQSGDAPKQILEAIDALLS